MRDESETYRYQGREFASREAMELFIASRAPVDVSAVRVDPAKGFGFGKVIAILAALFVVTCSFNASRAPSAPPMQVAAAPGTVALDDEVTQKAALVINVSGQLCARVTSITHLQGDVYSVSCIRYRDGTGVASYEMNAATGFVK